MPPAGGLQHLPLRADTVLSEPEAIAEFIKTKGPHARRICLETGPTATWLWHELRARGLPVIGAIDRHINLE